jgi:DNA-binding transcriptional ArsR family regulator
MGEVPAMMDPELIPEVAARFKALSDEGRLRLLAALKGGEMCVGELAEAVGRPQPNVSQHLASLTHSGLVAARRDGNRAFYRISDPTVLRICDAVCASLATDESGSSRGAAGRAAPAVATQSAASPRSDRLRQPARRPRRTGGAR